MSDVLKPIEDVTNRIRERSRLSRETYLERLRARAAQGPKRSTLSCGNLAHGFAACGPADKADLMVSVAKAKVGKVAVSCTDRAGFIVNALLFPYLNDAVKMLEAHYATADDIDTAMKQGCALPMGPFELLDVVGNDVSLAIQRELYLEFREPGFAPAPLLEHLVTAGYLGRKTKRGFRDYSAR